MSFTICERTFAIVSVVVTLGRGNAHRINTFVQNFERAVVYVLVLPENGIDALGCSFLAPELARLIRLESLWLCGEC